ncbi:MAG: RluA family pseudouridine synthase [Bacteroidia bacterium]
MNEVHFKHIVQQAAPQLQDYLKGRIHGIGLQQLESLFHQERILLNQQPARPEMPVKAGDCIDLYRRYLAQILPEAIPIEKIYEDEHLLVINKAAGMPVHPGLGHHQGTLLHALAYYYQQTGQVQALLRAAIVHRLDKDTSGLLVLAKTKKSKTALESMFRKGEIKRIYHAWVWGIPAPEKGSIHLAIGRNPWQPKLITPDPSGAWGKPALTHYRLCAIKDQKSLLELQPETGRTHQLRVHLHAIGHGIIGDCRYVQAEPCSKSRLLLHASRLTFEHPFTGILLELDSPAPFTAPA